MSRLVAGMMQSLDGYLAASLTDLGLVDEYRLYVRPFVPGGGKPYFAGARPPLRIIASDRVDEDAVRLACIAA